MLSTQYSSVFRTPIESLSDLQSLFPLSNSGLNDVTFDSSDIEHAISELSRNAAYGPGILLMKCASTLSEPIEMSWTKCLDEGTVPDMLKQATITPIFKKGSIGLSSNCRHIALTLHVIKIFEKFLRKNIASYMEENNVFNPS